MAFDWASRRATATSMITKYGCRALLRRDGVDRDCIACEVSESPRSHQGELRNAVERVFLVSAENLDPPPDAEKDQLICLDPETEEEIANLRLIAPIGKLAPAGVVVYWEIQARR